MAIGFTRQEAIELTGVNSSKLSYLDRIDLVKPLKLGNLKHPTVLYSWEQILQLKTIARLRERLPLQEIRKVLEFLHSRGYQESLFDCNLVFIGSQLYLLENWQDFGMKVLEASGKNQGQVVIHQVGAIGSAITDLRREAERNQVANFEERAGLTKI